VTWRRSLAAVLALAVAAGCGSGDGSGGACTPAVADPCRSYATVRMNGFAACMASGAVADGTACGAGLTCQAGACTASGTASVDAKGGAVAIAGGPRLELPPGALDGLVTVEVAQLPDPPPLELRPVTAAYQLRPVRAVFATPARLVFPLPPGTTAASIYLQRLDGLDYDAIGGTIDRAAHTITAEVAYLAPAFVGAASATRVVTVVAALTSVSPVDRHSEPRLFVTAPEAIVADGQGGHAVLPGAAVAGGAWAYRIPGVPAGPYLLRQYDTYVETDASAVDLGMVTRGASARHAHTPTGGTSAIVDVSLSGLAPIEAVPYGGTQLEAFTTDSGFWDFSLEDGSALAPGDVQGSIAIDLARSGFLIEGSKGDQLYLAQTSTRTASSGLRYAALSRFGLAPAFDAVPGGHVAVSAALVEPPQRTAALDWPGASWSGALARAGAPGNGCADRGAGTCSGFLELRALAALPSDGLTGASLGLLDLAEDGGQHAAEPLSYGDPDLPGTWSRLGVLSWGASRQLAIPGVDRSVTVYDRISWYPSAAALRGPLPPPVTPPTSVRVAGRDYFAGGVGIGAAPTLTWAAPASGPAPVYRLTVTVESSSPVATLTTAGTRLTLPAGLLSAGSFYVFHLSACAPTGAGAMLRVTAPDKQGADTACATIASGAFTP
jgi:hypothetical protein